MWRLLSTLIWSGAIAAPQPNSACPGEAAVAAELNRLGASAAVATLGSPEVTVDRTLMRVVLRDQNGSIVGAREVAAPETCHERASVAAVFIAAWAGVWTTVPSPTPASLPGPAPAPAPVSAPVTAAQGRSATTIEIAGLAFGTHDGEAGTIGAGVSAAYRLGKGLAAAALFETTGQRETALGPGLAAYRTSRLGLGASVSRTSGHLFADAGILPELTMLNVEGRQLVASHSVTTWGAAVDLRGRLGFAAGRFVPFLFAGGSWALRTERMTLDGSPKTKTLSRWNLSAGAGLAILLGGVD